MADSYASPAEVAGLLASVNTAAKDFEVATGGESHVARRNLQLQTRKLLAALEEPNTEVWPRIFQVNVGIAVDVATNLGIWKKLETKRTISLAEIVVDSGGDEDMIVRVLRHLVAAGVLEDIPGPGYAITAIGLPYLNPDHQNFNNLMIQDIIPIIVAMPRLLHERGYKAPTKESGSPFQWFHNQELWTWLGSHPDRAKVMVSGMRSHNAGNVSGGAYPFGTELGKLDIKDEEVAIVDIAGGHGHILGEIRKRNPSLRGKFICQDLQSTFDAFPDPPPGVEFMAHDIFTPQPIKNARIYHLRHIIHDWGDEESRSILRQIVPRLRENPESKLLLADLVIPESNVTMQEAIRDFSMFSIGGNERTVKQWTALLAAEGLRIKKIWRGSEPEACVECELI